MSSKKNHSHTAWTPETLPVPESETRSAAAAWYCINKFGSESILNDLKKVAPDADSFDEAVKAFYSDYDIEAVLKVCFPNADFSKVENYVHLDPPFASISDDLLDEILEQTHTENYPILPWREANLRILTLDFLATLKSSSANHSEDAVVRITRVLGDEIRGTTKNACQTIAGVRSKIRKKVREISILMLYNQKYRADQPIGLIREGLNSLVKPFPNPDFINDDYAFDEYLTNDEINAKGRFVISEAVQLVQKVDAHIETIDELIQKSSKNWRINRMALVDLNILRLATYELYFEKLSTPRILINEAVELAKVFGAEQSKGFVNGILQQLCNDNGINVE
ncbi:MAG: transcription antitermination factor NusB [Proteobacteria bacterium]|nr:transcription antitermination factor NusB [Pseudomonadota bacterium]